VEFGHYQDAAVALSINDALRSLHVICSQNTVPGPDSKIPYSVPNMVFHCDRTKYGVTENAGVENAARA